MFSVTTVFSDRPVSTSEAADYAKCQTVWKYKYHKDYRLTPLTDGPAIQLGVTGHSALEFFYNELKDGVSWVDAKFRTIERLSNAVIMAVTNGDAEKAAMFSDLVVIIGEYFNEYADQLNEWEILEVEFKVQALIPTSTLLFNFIGRVDLLIRYKSGPFKGMIAPVDHKFVYNFWKLKAFEMTAQAPNYIAALQYMFPNERIKHLLVNQLRYRMDAKERFNQTPIAPTHAKMMGVIENHSKIAGDINVLSCMSREDVDIAAHRTLVKTTCEYCNLSSLCNAQLEGLDTATMEAVNFKRNTYGYHDTDDDSDL